ncbi:hypothetical protein KCH_60010 [Kitasatospora cheerisanensis KCTC 2395]|uniref:Uncharacterized protein n=1 Tax=Kitasatospora cheerisanensis KCTC 2395 TaxID=1348663 RepID=A0A066YMC8_9ACTN|nr:hypothetical protein KCH_60010 [Kitasatospora cheerisanensis KCTC 2395]
MIARRSRSARLRTPPAPRRTVRQRGTDPWPPTSSAPESPRSPGPPPPWPSPPSPSSPDRRPHHRHPRTLAGQSTGHSDTEEWNGTGAWCTSCIK